MNFGQSNQVHAQLSRTLALSANTEASLYTVSPGKTLWLKIISYNCNVSSNGTSEVRVYNDSGVFQYVLHVCTDYYNHHSISDYNGEWSIPAGWELRVCNLVGLATFDDTMMLGWEV